MHYIYPLMIRKWCISFIREPSNSNQVFRSICRICGIQVHTSPPSSPLPPPAPPSSPFVSFLGDEPPVPAAFASIRSSRRCSFRFFNLSGIPDVGSSSSCLCSKWALNIESGIYREFRMLTIRNTCSFYEILVKFLSNSSNIPQCPLRGQFCLAGGWMSPADLFRCSSSIFCFLCRFPSASRSAAERSCGVQKECNKCESRGLCAGRSFKSVEGK
jgi:hypothetical protein